MNNRNIVDVTTGDATSFAYKSSILGNPNATEVLKDAKIVTPLKYLSNFLGH